MVHCYGDTSRWCFFNHLVFVVVVVAVVVVATGADDGVKLCIHFILYRAAYLWILLGRRQLSRYFNT